MDLRLCDGLKIRRALDLEQQQPIGTHGGDWYPVRRRMKHEQRAE
jgi:hypothetical protein